MTRLLVVEDTRERQRWFGITFNHCDVTVVNDEAQAVELVRTERPFDVVCLDHDLIDQGPGHGTGRGVATAVIAERLADPARTRFVVHSVNSVSARKIESELAAAGYAVVRLAFPMLAQRVRCVGDLNALFAAVPA